jgi:hypothetical protein
MANFDVDDWDNLSLYGKAMTILQTIGSIVTLAGMATLVVGIPVSMIRGCKAEKEPTKIEYQTQRKESPMYLHLRNERGLNSEINGLEKATSDNNWDTFFNSWNTFFYPLSNKEE